LTYNTLLAQELQVVIDAMPPTEIQSGSTIFEQGARESSPRFYVVETGTVEIVKDGEIVATLGAGGCFGELSLLYSSPRAAAARTQGEEDKGESPVKLWGLEKRVFRRLIARSINRGEAALCHWLRGVPLLQPLSRHDLLLLASGAETVHHWAGEVIVRQGDIGDAMYIIRQGKVTVTTMQWRVAFASAAHPAHPTPLHDISPYILSWLASSSSLLAPPLSCRTPQVKCSVHEAEDEHGDSLARELQVLGPGDYFGELALLGDGSKDGGGMDQRRRRASVIAMGSSGGGGTEGGADSEAERVTCLKVSRALFNGLLGPLRALLDQHICSRKLRSIPLFKLLPKFKRQQIAAETETLAGLKRGDVVVKEGDPSDAFYIVREGTLKVTQRTGRRKGKLGWTAEDDNEDDADDDEDDEVEEVELSKLRSGDFFGEVGLIQRINRTATVTVVSAAAVLLKVRRGTFTSHIAGDEGGAMLRKELLRASQLRQAEAAVLNPTSGRHLNFHNVFGETVVLRSPAGSKDADGRAGGGGGKGNANGGDVSEAEGDDDEPAAKELNAINPHFDERLAKAGSGGVEKLCRIGSGTFANVYLVRQGGEGGPVRAMKVVQKATAVEQSQVRYI
jgi:CRP-like cAMP-binding protein